MDKITHLKMSLLTMGAFFGLNKRLKIITRLINNENNLHLLPYQIQSEAMFSPKYAQANRVSLDHTKRPLQFIYLLYLLTPKSPVTVI